MSREISVFPTADQAAQATANLIVAVASQSIREKGWFSLVLAGGSTPINTYRLLAEGKTDQVMDWSSTHIFFGDERGVLPSDERSNYGMAKEDLLSKIDIPAANIHRIEGELPPEEAARNYEHDIREFFRAKAELPDREPPSFDFILLGLGPDGHTASLFPGDDSLDEMEKWVVWTPHKKPPKPLVPRITLTLPILNAGRRVVFLVTGAGKASRAAEVLSEKGGIYPAGRVSGAGNLLWQLDQEAAQFLEGGS